MPKDAFEALHNITLEIEKGSMTAVIGKSGSGKSTLLRNKEKAYRTISRLKNNA